MKQPPMSNSKLKSLIGTLKSVMQGDRNTGIFFATLIDCGLRNSANSRSALEFRKSSTWKSYANGSKPMSKSTASELVSRWDIELFSENLQETLSEDALNALAEKLHAQYPYINKGNVSVQLGELFFEIFAEVAGKELHNEDSYDVKNASSLYETPQLKNSIPYIDIKTSKIRLSDYALNLPPRQDLPDDIEHKELPYVKALIHAYCEKIKTDDESLTQDDIPQRYKAHLSEQRKAFFSTEWVKETSWNLVEDGKTAYDNFLDVIYQGVIDVILEDHPSEVHRLLETLKQSTSIQLDSLKLAQIQGLIDPLSRKGACHELINQERISWS